MDAEFHRIAKEKLDLKNSLRDKIKKVKSGVKKMVQMEKKFDAAKILSRTKIIPYADQKPAETKPAEDKKPKSEIAK